jgi:hypothetical protein
MVEGKHLSEKRLVEWEKELGFRGNTLVMQLAPLW